MVLPRPARVIHQCHSYPRTLHAASTLSSTRTSNHPRRAFTTGTPAAAARAQLVENDVEGDESYDRRQERLRRSWVSDDVVLNYTPTASLSQSASRSQAGIEQTELEYMARMSLEETDDDRTVQLHRSKNKQKGSFGIIQTTEDGERDDHDLEDAGPREERRSPAAILGSKRMGMTTLPQELTEVIEDAVGEVDSSRIRYNFVRLKTEPKIKRSKNPPEVEMALAKATAFLPGEFSAVRNVMEEIGRRLGRDWLDQAQAAASTIQQREEGEIGIHSVDEISSGEAESSVSATRPEDSARPRIVEVSGGLGAGLWGLLDSRGTLPSAQIDGEEVKVAPVDFQFYSANKQTLDMARILGHTIPDDVANVDYLRKLDRNFISTTPSLAMSTFFLSTLPPAPRDNHLKALLSLSSPYIILIDHANRAGWEAISQARKYLLSRSTDESPLHIVAPCPHDGECPLANTEEICGYSQRLQSPRFSRKTKHSKRGEEDKQYCYLVVARGARPQSTSIGESIGRIGGVGKEFMRKEQAKLEGKSVLVKVEGRNEGERDQFDMIPLAEQHSDPSGTQLMEKKLELEDGLPEGGVLSQLRAEAYSWPRLVAPPMKRSGHVTIDACSASGNIERTTFARSHGKQSYHDARKIFWGDLFPHPPKGKVIIRTRGVKHLTRPTMVDGDAESEEVFAELFGRDPAQHEDDMEGMPEGVKIEIGTKSRKSKREEEKKKKFELGKHWREIQEDRQARPGKWHRVIRRDQFDPTDSSLDFVAEPEELVRPEVYRQSKTPIRRREAPVPTEVDGKKSKRLEDMSDMEFVAADESLDTMPIWMRGAWSETTVVNSGPDGKTNVEVRRNGAAGSRGGSGGKGGKGGHREGRRGFATLARHPVGLDLSTSITQRRFMSVRPRERPSVAGRPKVTIAELNRLRASKTPITVLTAYDYPTSLLSESTGIDVCLVGDSLSQVALGHDTTTQITLDEMIHHSKAVTRGAKTPFVFADLPFGSFESSIEKGVESVVRLIKEGGVDGIKIEGGKEIVPLVQRLSDMGIAVIPHIGLQPQRATSTSGYLVQGRTASSAQAILDTALALEAAGSTMLLLEAVPHGLASYITERVSVPTIGIGAGPGTNGQVLVITDVLGVYAPDEDLELPAGTTSQQPRFVKQYGNAGHESRVAIREYINSVKEGTFPVVGQHTYGMKKDEWEAFLRSQEDGVSGRLDKEVKAKKESEVEGTETEDGA